MQNSFRENDYKDDQGFTNALAMADLNFNEKQAIEKLFGMPTGYVLGFSDTIFQSFIGESVGIDIHSEKVCS